MLRNICSKIVVFIEHKRARTLDTDVVRHALQSLSVKLPRYTSNPEEFEPCKVFKKERTKASTKSAKKRGNVAEAERDFEQQNLDCLYMERAPFARLLHSVLIAVYSEERLDVTGPEQLKMSKRACSLLHFVFEQLIIMLLFAAEYVLIEFSKGHGSKSKQVTLNGRNFMSIVHLLRGDMSEQVQDVMKNAKMFGDMETQLWPILHGALDIVRARPKGGAGNGRGRGSSDRGRGNRGWGRGRGPDAGENRGRGRGRGRTKRTAYTQPRLQALGTDAKRKYCIRRSHPGPRSEQGLFGRRGSMRSSAFAAALILC